MKFIQNVQLIEQIFGEWPSFHDAEIHSILLSRDCVGGPELHATIHHWEMTPEVGSDGYYVLKHHTLSTLIFSDIFDLTLSGFNHQNVLCDLSISEIEESDSDARFSVSMPTSYGCETSFKCGSIRVSSVVPFNKPE